VALSAGSAGSARFRVSSDGISYSDIATVSTGGTASLSFPILLRKDYYYYVDATRTSLWWADPVATITYFR
jgi:hypothetical protein